MEVGQSRQRRSLFVSPLRRADDGYRPLPRFVRAVASIAAVVRQPAFSPIMGCEKAVAFPLQHPNGEALPVSLADLERQGCGRPAGRSLLGKMSRRFWLRVFMTTPSRRCAAGL